jgi:hypothetical protein
MDAGVGASGALGQKLLSGEALDGLRQGTLDGGLAGLDLPAVKGGAIIGEGEFEGSRGHGFDTSRILGLIGCRVCGAMSRRIWASGTYGWEGAGIFWDRKCL